MTTTNLLDHTISIAPMIDWTDRHFRYFMRLIAPTAWVYTEMLTTGAILNGDKVHLLDFSAEEHPVALQLGGSDPTDLANCAAIGERFGYAEINLNIGCPSPRVSQGRFGACLMAEPEHVAMCVRAMQAQVKIPITVKTRLGIDTQDSYPELVHFIKTVADAGCNLFILHARKAWLSGLSPKENREIPPLNYDWVYQIKRDFPKLTIIINGGISETKQVVEHLTQVDGVMIGRAAVNHSYWLSELTQALATNVVLPTRTELLIAYLPYVEKQLQKGVRLNVLCKPLFGLWQGERGARQLRRYLSEKIHCKTAGIEVLQALLAEM